MTLFIYNFIWKVLEKIVPYYLKFRINKGKEDKNRINERYGIASRKRNKGRLAWLHGSSVGESVAAIALANSMLKNGFNKKDNSFF